METLRKIVHYGAPVLVIVVSLFIMQGGSLIKGPTSAEDDVSGLMNTLERNVLAGEWGNAEAVARELVATWSEMIPRVQFSGERRELQDLTTSLHRLVGYTMAQDVGGALAELAEAREHWTDMAR